MAIQFLNTVAVDTNVLYVDTANDRVGIGTTSPNTALEVDGAISKLHLIMYRDQQVLGYFLKLPVQEILTHIFKLKTLVEQVAMKT